MLLNRFPAYELFDIGVIDIDDNCPLFPNAGQQDQDLDNVGTDCDNCHGDGLGTSSGWNNLTIDHDNMRIALERAIGSGAAELAQGLGDRIG